MITFVRKGWWDAYLQTLINSTCIRHGQHEKGDFIVDYAKEPSLKKYGQLAFTAFLQESLNAMQTLKFRTFFCRFSELH
jgi:hypothetical protein